MATFAEMSAGHREAYVALWARSAFVTKRRFYRTSKALICMTAYSMDAFWDAIGYDGPLVD